MSRKPERGWHETEPERQTGPKFMEDLEGCGKECDYSKCDEKTPKTDMIQFAFGTIP